MQQVKTREKQFPFVKFDAKYKVSLLLTGLLTSLWLISQLHASESIHGMYDVTSGCSRMAKSVGGRLEMYTDHTI